MSTEQLIERMQELITKSRLAIEKNKQILKKANSQVKLMSDDRNRKLTN